MAFRGRNFGGASVDREKVCPLLLRVFIKNGPDHHTAEDFAGGVPKEHEVQIYTWKDATLQELTDLIKGINKQARSPTAKLSFAFVYPDQSGKNVVKPIGITHSSRRSPDQQKTLQFLRFETGDYLDVAISEAQ